MIRRHLLLSLVISVASTAFVGACSKSDKRGPEPGEIPESVAVAAARVTLGLPSAPARKEAEVAPFTIARSPVTVWHYRRCVDAGGCSAVPAGRCADPSTKLGSTSERPEADRLPMSCVTVAEAQAYCAWVGGRLPNAAEWLFATRGNTPSPYPWGDAPLTCERHPEAKADCCTGDCALPKTHAVGTHAAGASPSGVNDALLSRGELVAPWADTFFGACAAPHAACVAYGHSPAALDGFAPANEQEPIHETTFRCAWEVSR